MAERGRKRRKKRDSTTHVKPPLDFIESPVNGRKYYCTPVQAARRPFLATSLPVDDKEALKWVRYVHTLVCFQNLFNILGVLSFYRNISRCHDVQHNL